MDSMLAKIAEQWPLMAFILLCMVTCAGALWKAYWAREKAREDREVARESVETKRREALEAQARADKQSCEERLVQTENRLNAVMETCVNRNSTVMAEVGGNLRELAAAVDRQTRAYTEKRDPTPIQPARTHA